MNKRKWCYIQKPVVYDVFCDICGGSNTTWSEFEHKIWCYDCEIDTGGTPGIFDGPIPVNIAKNIGINFNRINLETNKLEYFYDNEYISEEEYIIKNTINVLSNKHI